MLKTLITWMRRKFDEFGNETAEDLEREQNAFYRIRARRFDAMREERRKLRTIKRLRVMSSAEISRLAELDLAIRKVQLKQVEALRKRDAEEDARLL